MPVWDEFFSENDKMMLANLKPRPPKPHAQFGDRAARIAEGYRNVRVQVDIGGSATYGAGPARQRANLPENQRTRTWEPGPYVRTVPRLFEHLRNQLGDQVELLHDVHERVPPVLAMQLVKDLESYHPFFVEDPFAPEYVGYFEHLRRQTSTPIAMACAPTSCGLIPCPALPGSKISHGAV